MAEQIQADDWRPRLIALDIDGTLLRWVASGATQEEISPAVYDAVHRAANGGARCVWLGVNQNNQRAQRFYGKHGFTIVGTKTFTVGAALENDFVMVRPLGGGD